MFAIDHILWNDQMDVVANIVVIVNMLMAFGAGVLNLYASVHNPEPWKRIRFLIGMFALVYSGSYFWLLASEDLVQWSSVMRGVSLIAWPLVWIAPAWVSVKVWIDVKKIIEVEKIVFENDQKHIDKDNEQLKRNEEQ